jgi:hypothetical protein
MDSEDDTLFDESPSHYPPKNPNTKLMLKEAQAMKMMKLKHQSAAN